MIKYYLHIIFLLLFGAVLSDLTEISNPKFWIMICILLLIIYTYHTIMSEEDESDEKNDEEP